MQKELVPFKSLKCENEALLHAAASAPGGWAAPLPLHRSLPRRTGDARRGAGQQSQRGVAFRVTQSRMASRSHVVGGRPQFDDLEAVAD